MPINEPHVKQGECSYCGDAPINHSFSYLESIVTVALDNRAKFLLKYVPRFIKNFVDAVPEALYRTLAVLGMVEFSRDISKARTFRSKIIWEEASRRGINMEQVFFLGKPLDYYRARLNLNRKGKPKIRHYYFESIPIRPEFLDSDKNWDDKVLMKREFAKHGIPIPAYFELSSFSSFGKTKKIFSGLKNPIIVKPRVGSRGRHTITNINTLEQFRKGIDVAGEICAHLVAEEHLEGNVCRATVVNGNVAGFYMGQAPTLVGDGQKTIKELIEEKDNERKNRIEPIRITDELFAHIGRAGFTIDDVLPKGVILPLSHRIGRLFGGTTREMIDDLHPSFVPIIKKAAEITRLSVVGFDCIIPDPTKDANTQKWGIIECNTLPFIDLHYFALFGKPRNIAGMIWDMWK